MYGSLLATFLTVSPSCKTSSPSSERVARVVTVRVARSALCQPACTWRIDASARDSLRLSFPRVFRGSASFVMLAAAHSCVLKVLQAPRYREPHASRWVCLSPCSCALDCWFSNGLAVPSSCIEVKRIFALVWGAQELWVRGVLDDGNDHSSNKLICAQSSDLP